jgi:hypothetical protein
MEPPRKLPAMQLQDTLDQAVLTLATIGLQVETVMKSTATLQSQSRELHQHLDTVSRRLDELAAQVQAALNRGRGPWDVVYLVGIFLLGAIAGFLVWLF